MTCKSRKATSCFQGDNFSYSGWPPMTRRSGHSCRGRQPQVGFRYSHGPQRKRRMELFELQAGMCRIGLAAMESERRVALCRVAAWRQSRRNEGCNPKSQATRVKCFTLAATVPDPTRREPKAEFVGVLLGRSQLQRSSSLISCNGNHSPWALVRSRHLATVQWLIRWIFLTGYGRIFLAGPIPVTYQLDTVALQIALLTRDSRS